MMTVAEIFPSLQAHVGSSGNCSKDKLMEAMNVAGPVLLDAVDAKGSMWTWRLHVCGGCVILPSEIHRPQQAWFCGQSVGFRSEWWLGRLTGNPTEDLGQEFPWQELVDTGREVATQCVVDADKRDRFFLKARHRDDLGKQVEVRYVNPDGQEIVWKSTLQPIRKMTAGQGDLSPTGIGEVIRVAKGRTAGAVELWVWRQTGAKSPGEARLISVYDSHDETPSYRVYRLTGAVGGGTVTVKGKRKWRPLRSEDDIVPFGSVAAWRAALAWEAASNNRQSDEAKAHLADAVYYLDLEETGSRPRSESQPVTVVTPWGLR